MSDKKQQSEGRGVGVEEILIVEDSPTQAERLRYLLEENGYGVTVAENGAAALAHLSSQTPGLVISDIVMPEMNGFELCNRIKGEQQSQEIPVILLTSLSDPEDVLEGLTCGADDFITKPYNEQDLLAHVCQILTNRRLWAGDRVRLGIEIIFGGKRRFITADKQKMLTLLISTYEAAVHRNTELVKTQEELQALNDHLEELVEERTAALLAEISERKQLEADREKMLAQIQEEARRVQQIVDTVPTAVVLLDRKGHLLLTNPAAQRDLAVLAPAWREGKLTHLGERPLAELLEAPANGLWHEIQAGSRTYELIARPILLALVPEKWVLVIVDVTQERETQTRIQHQGRLATLGQMAAGIAHDFNNIMGTIILHSQLLHRSPALTEKDQSRLSTVLEQTQHATNLIRQILDFSRASVMDSRPVNLLPFLKEMVNLLARTLPESIHIGLEAIGDEFLVETDLSRIQQVFLNLALNARDAMPEGGSLRIRMERLNAAAGDLPIPNLQPGEWLRLTVADTGTGIAPEILPRIFDPFFTTKASTQGTGLGLAQVYGIIKQHGGEIVVESKVGAGTTFTLYLPAATAPVRAENPLGPLPHTGADGGKILVVEDQETLRRAIQEILEDSGYQIVTAANGREAVEIFQAQHATIDLVLSDMVMPEMGGMELMRVLRTIEPATKIILTTGYPLQEADKELLRQRVIPWIQKPFFGTKLTDAIRQALESEPVA